MTLLARFRDGVARFRAGLKKTFLANLGEELVRDWRHEQVIQSARQLGELEELIRSHRAAGNDATAAVLEAHRAQLANSSPSLESLHFFDELSAHVEGVVEPVTDAPRLIGSEALETNGEKPRRGRPPGSKNKRSPNDPAAEERP